MMKMKTIPIISFHWPEIPPLPPPGQPVVIRVITGQSRQAARQELRTVLRRMLAAWGNLSTDQLQLQETPRGPVWFGQFGGHALDISLSYAEGEGWIGLLRDGFIGLDAMQGQLIPEAEDVSRHYLGGNASEAIRQSTDPAMAFARAWTELEARIKCLKQELNECSATQAIRTNKCAVQSMVFPNRLIVTVATLTSIGLRNLTIDGQPLKLDYIFSAADSKESQRARLTIEPTNQALGLAIDSRLIPTAGVQPSVL